VKSRTKVFFYSLNWPYTMQKTHPARVTPAMEKYILSRSTDLRVATTCEGPLIFSIKVSPPKPTDLVMAVGERKVYISALQAQYLKAIDERMLPRCALQKRQK